MKSLVCGACGRKMTEAEWGARFGSMRIVAFTDAELKWLCGCDGAEAMFVSPIPGSDLAELIKNNAMKGA